MGVVSSGAVMGAVGSVAITSTVGGVAGAGLYALTYDGTEFVNAAMFGAAGGMAIGTVDTLSGHARWRDPSDS